MPIISIAITLFYANKVYKNNEAEIGKKKKEQIKNILRLEISKTKNENKDDLRFFQNFTLKAMTWTPPKSSFLM